MKQNPFLYALFALLFGMAAMSQAALTVHAETLPVDPSLEMIPQQAYPADVYGTSDYSAQLAGISEQLQIIIENTSPTETPEPSPSPEPSEEPSSVFEKPFEEYTLVETLLTLLCVICGLIGFVCVLALLARRL